PFTFYGFLNSKENKRKQELEKLKNVKSTLIFYEAPHRLLDTLGNILEVFGNRKISISREITKKYEEIYRGYIKDVISELDNIKGEFVIVVEGANIEIDFNSIDVKCHINFYLEQGYDLKNAMKLVAKDRGLSKSEIYSNYHKEDL
ncbi:MAG: 16S rRNA (cytidine(1402)-2'-O)-methyltransferase, partial [Firmicutes bacterium]|nr:16S rRNA (cytidine(1402)-2'-O)-methyltransferase [Bacillota bacterium]